jgi:Leucine-rich repeat (LRR) protein
VSLSVLDVSSNRLTALPLEIGKLTSLSSLYVGYNKLKTLPSEIGDISSLEKLNIMMNDIDFLPLSICNLKNLKELDVSFNNLSSLPRGLGNLGSEIVIYTRICDPAFYDPNKVNVNILENKITQIPWQYAVNFGESARYLTFREIVSGRSIATYFNILPKDLLDSHLFKYLQETPYIFF